MIAVDTSALMAVVLAEDRAAACIDALATADRLLISAASVAELLVVAARRNVGPEAQALVDGLGFEVIDVTAATALRVAAAYARWGRGSGAASLNFGDCFSYVVAEEHACPLLYVGDDFTATGVARAI